MSLNPNILKAFKESRGEPISYLQNFIINISTSAQLMHAVLREFRTNEAIFKEACKNYIISLTSCLETFYRDLYVFVLEKDPESLKLILPELREKVSLAEVHALLESGFSFAEITSTRVNFQNLEQVECFFSKIFRPTGYLGTMDAFELECFIISKMVRAKIRLPENWRSKLSQLLMKRHEYVHNANSKFTLTSSEMAETEALVLLLVQLTSHCMAQKFGGKSALHLGEFPAILLVDDLLADDWEPATDEQVAIGMKKE